MSPHYPPLYLRPNSERTVRNGHPWIFSGAVARPPKTPTPAISSMSLTRMSVSSVAGSTIGAR